MLCATKKAPLSLRVPLGRWRPERHVVAKLLALAVERLALISMNTSDLVLLVTTVVVWLLLAHRL